MWDRKGEKTRTCLRRQGMRECLHIRKEWVPLGRRKKKKFFIGNGKSLGKKTLYIQEGTGKFDEGK